MVVYREESAKEDNMYDIIDVQLTKKPGKGLGLSIVGRKNGKGVFISDFVPGGVAESDGRLMQGDQILEVNENDLRNAKQEHAAAILKCATAYVSLKIGRLKPGKKVTLNAWSTWPVTICDDSPRSSLNSESQFSTVNILQQSPSQPNSLNKNVPHYNFVEVCLIRGEDGLGFSIVGGYGSNLGNLPIYVKSVFEKGAASKEGTLRRGDQILKVNGQSLEGLTHGQAVSLLKEVGGTVRLTILPQPN